MVALITRLPAELLTEIFLWLQASYVEHYPEEILKWILVTHVSKRWRLIAFNSKELWTTIPTHQTAYAQLASRLSSPLLVSITDEHFMPSSQPSEETLGTFASLFPRARKIQAMSEIGSHFARALENTPLEFPRLQDLEIDEVAMHLTDISPFPNTLKCLRLSHSSFEWNWFDKLDRLTELHLCHNTSNGITVESFVDYMSQIPNLSHLEIRGLFYVSDEDSDTSSSHEDAATITLRHLTVWDSLGLVADLLSFIEFTEDFTFHGELGVDEETPDTIEAFFQEIERHLQASQWVIRRASLLVNHKDFLTLSCFDQDGSTPFLFIEGQEIPDETKEALLDGMQTISFGTVQRLLTDAFTDMAKWKDCCFRSLESLQELDIRNHESTDAFLRFLVSDADAARQSNDWNSISFPALKKVTFRGVQHHRHIEWIKSMAGVVFTVRALHGFEVEEFALYCGNTMDDGLHHLPDWLITE
ncbi:hypothetical protein BDN72DRAFT_843809 [Pluteus cervinus]|uniref:Uncharacterized protein n=1 Tax=Pluteus cervinus TaxID=181527 RepID=A0ACD3AMU3_9AGAR|nr:hypothetical protein BDN72DRAFT_843809 [Pluteus cervinus]